jgi:integral membrane protein (TIGR00529 family)
MIQLIGLATAFAFIVVLTSKRVSAALSITIGAMTLAIWHGASVQDFIYLSAQAIADRQAISLTLQVTVIGMLGYCMKETKLIDDLIRGLKTVLSTRTLIAVIPAIVGLMPMPGGAFLSAPLIDEEADKLKMTPERKVVVNITFRHIWFYVFPLSSTLILAAGLAGIGLYQLIVTQIPSFVLAVSLGYFFFVRRLTRDPDRKAQRDYIDIIKGLTPILLAVGLNLAGLDLALSVGIGIFSSLLIKRITPRKAMQLIWKGIPWGPALSIVAVMIFRRVIEDSKAISTLFDILQEANVPLTIFATALPLIIGAVSGLAIAGAGISIPFVVPLFGTATPALVSMIVLSTYAGYYISPLHLCLVLSNQYFKAKIQRVYRLWIPYTLIVCGVGILFDMLLLLR